MLSSREGFSRDYDPERRLHIWETFNELKDKKSYTDIAIELGIHPSVFTQIRKSKWWAALSEGNSEDA